MIRVTLRLVSRGPAGKVGAAGDEAGAAFVGHVRPCPLNENEQAVAESDEIENVNEEPGEPGEESGDVNAAEFGDGGGASDGGDGAFVPVVEGGTSGAEHRIPRLQGVISVARITLFRSG